jgi:hypothetical protein
LTATLCWHLITVPGRLTRHGRHLVLRLPPLGVLPRGPGPARELRAPPDPHIGETRLPAVASGPGRPDWDAALQDVAAHHPAHAKAQTGLKNRSPAGRASGVRAAAGPYIPAGELKDARDLTPWPSRCPGPETAFCRSKTASPSNPAHLS